MRVKVSLLGTHARFLPAGARGSSAWLQLSGDRVRIGEIRERLGMPTETPRIVYVGGVAVEEDDVVEDGAEVVFVSPLGGG